MKVLAIEDNDFQQMFYQEILPQPEYQLDFANDGRQGLDKLTKADAYTYDVILLDYMLPEIDGLQIMEKLQDRIEDFGILFVTADTSISTVIKAMRNGAMDFVTKSGLASEDFQALVQRVYDLQNARRENKRLQLALEESEQHYKSLFQNNQSAILLMDTHNGVIVDANDAAVKFYGYSKDELQGANIGLVSLLDKVESLQNIAKINDNQSNKFNVQHQLRNGDIRNVEIIGHLVKTANEEYIYAVVKDITDELFYRRELNAAQQRFRYFFEHSSDAITIMKADGQIIEWNSAHQQIDGFPAEEAVGKNFFELVDSLSIGHNSKQFAAKLKLNLEELAANATDEPLIRQHQITRADGSTKILQGLFFRFVYNDEIYLGSISRDITESVQAQIKIEENEKFLTDVFNAIQDGIAVVAPDMTILRSNPVLSERHKIVNNKKTKCHDLYFDRDKPCENCPAQLAFNKGRKSSIEKQMFIKDEVQPRWFEFTFYPIFNIEGKVEAIIEYSKDITLRKNAELELKNLNQSLEGAVEEKTHELQLSQTNYEKLFDNMLNAVEYFQLNENNKLIYQDVNKSACELHQLSKEQIIGKSMKQVGHWSSNSDSELFRDIYKVAQSGGSYAKEIQIPEMEQWLAISCYQSIVDSCVVISEDITDRVLYERKILSALEREKELVELKSKFVTVVSHEFRTPLAAISSSAELLGMYLQKADEVLRTKANKHIKRIGESVDNLTRLIEDILVLSKIEAGNYNFQPYRTNLVRLVEESLLEDLGEDWRKRIRLHNPEVTVLVDVDKRLMKQVFSNLVSNALKYSKAATQTPEISIEASKNNIVLSIRDYGIGIPEAEQEHIFQSFYRAENAHNIKGTGLGLIIVRDFLKLHKGHVSFTSVENKGTTFVVNLPKIYQSSDLN